MKNFKTSNEIPNYMGIGKVLIITYYWPPAGGPGVQRWLKFVKYLRDFDIEPVVYVPENPHYPLQDTSLLKEIPEGIVVLKKHIKEPYFLAKIFSKKKTKQISSGIITTKKQSLVEKLLLWVRGNLFIPDARVLWVKPSVAYLSKYLKEENINLIITSGPPHSIHLIGLKLQEKMGVKWVADFRDPWTSIGYHYKLKLTKKSQNKHEQLEAKVLQAADQIIVTSPTTKAQFEILTDTPIEVITNGFDVAISEEKSLDDKFTISHIGSLLTERNPVSLWKVLSELVSENKDFSNDFQLQLAGVVSDEVLQIISSFGLQGNLKNLGYLSHSDAIAFQRKSQVLLIVEIDSLANRAIIPGKLFEYMAANRPILALGPKGSDMEEIIETTESGQFLAYANDTELKKTIVSWYHSYKGGNLTLQSVGVGEYHRKHLTGKLAEIIRNNFTK